MSNDDGDDDDSDNAYYMCGRMVVEITLFAVHTMFVGLSRCVVVDDCRCRLIPNPTSDDNDDDDESGTRVFAIAVALCAMCVVH